MSNDAGSFGVKFSLSGLCHTERGSRRISVSADCIRRLVYCTTAADSARSADSLDHDDFPCALMINSDIRTYLRPADTVFLIPQESRMKKYFSTAWFSGVIYKIIGLGLVMLILWPLYIRAMFHQNRRWLRLLF